MEAAVLFLLGFTSVVSVYEIFKTGKSRNAEKIVRSTEKAKRVTKKK